MGTAGLNGMNASVFSPMPLKRWLPDLYAAMKEDNVFNGAAALGFFMTLAIFPALVVVMAALPYLPIERVDQAIMHLLRQALPGDAASLLSGVVDSVTHERRGGLLSLGALALLWSASTGMYAIMQQLNVTYDVKERRGFLRARATAIALTLLFSMLVMGALTLVVLGGFIQSWIGERFGFSGALLAFFAGLRWLIILAALFLGFATVYRYAPNTRERFRFVSAGSLVGVPLLVAASVGFSLYTRHFADFNATYGSIGAMVVLMLWLYIAGLVILLGAEINILGRRHRGDARAG